MQAFQPVGFTGLTEMNCETCGQTLEEWESGRCEGCGILFSKIPSDCRLTVRQIADKIYTHETQVATRDTTQGAEQ